MKIADFKVENNQSTEVCLLILKFAFCNFQFAIFLPQFIVTVPRSVTAT